MGNFLVAPGWGIRSLADATEDCWNRAGVQWGMRVLDVGCGAGDSTFLAARLVGKTGWAVGIDRDHQAVRRARQRADEMSIENVEFHEGDCGDEGLLGAAPFDAVLGRLYLVQSAEPAVELRRLARLVRPGGLMAFVEAEFDYECRTEAAGATVPQTEQALAWLQAACREMGVQMNAVTTLPRVFLEAGLGWPQMRSYQAVAGETGLNGAIQGLMTVVGGQARRRAEKLGLTEAEGLLAAPAPVAGAWLRLG